MAVAICIPLPDPVTPPRINLPYIGVFEKAREGIYDAGADFAGMLAKMQDQLAVALAPVRQFLELVDAIMAIKQCIESIPKSLMPPSPKPILDCLQKLLKVIGILLRYIPPFPYIITIMDLISIEIDLIDEVVSLFVTLDQQITQSKNALADALNLNDLDLQSILSCGDDEIQILIGNSGDLLQLMQPMIDMMLNPILSYIPNPVLRDKLDEMKDLDKQIKDLQTQIRSGGSIPTAGLVGSLVTALYAMRSVLVTLYNALAPVIGKEPDKVMTTPPTFSNL